MIPQLKPEIQLLIAKHVKRPYNVHDGRFPSVEKVINADQDTLVNLMKTSKAMYDICAPVLYGDCAPYDFISFAAGLRSNENVDRTARIHIRHKQLWVEATYCQIFESGWDALEIKSRLGVNPIGRDLQRVMEECHGLVQEGNKIWQFINKGLTILPNLETVSMGGIGESLYNAAGGFTAEQMYSCHFEDHAKILPLALINLPTMRNYCQTVFYGPLALPNKIIKVNPGIQTFTCHFRGSSTFSDCLTVQETRSPPIILGAINRFFCEMAIHVPYPILDINTAEAEFAAMLRPIVAMMDRSVHIVDPVTGEPIKHNGNINFVNGTKVEIYDFVRAVDRSKLDSSGKICIDPDETIQALAPVSLAFLQRTLDQALPQQWKGKVVLKNREEAPPCPACGLDPQEEFKDVLEFYRSMMASKGKAHAH